MMSDTNENDMGWNAVSDVGIVVAGGSEAVAAGIGILENGGNAADATAATIIALNITDHVQCSIGGEVPILIYDAKNDEVKAISGQGRAPLSQDAVDWYMENGIPGDGDMKMAPVPSVIDSCATILQQYGTCSFEDILAASLALLDKGSEVWHPKLAVTLRRMIEEEQMTVGSREDKIQAACDRFYGRNKERNDIAEELVEYYEERGGFLTREDLAAHKSVIEEPVSINYKGYEVFKCGPWTQGPFLCQALRILEGFDLQAMGHFSADYIHVVTESIKLAMADRDEHYADPEFVDVPIDALFSAEYTELRRELIDMQKASLEARPGDPQNMKALKEGGVFRPKVGGTTTCVIADRWGNVVSATPSANVPASPQDGGKAGVTFGNRLVSLNTCKGHPNVIEPGKRPSITLTPTLVMKDGKPIIAISVAGGDLQDQIALNLLLDLIDFDMTPKEAIKAPRFSTRHHQDGFSPNPDREKAFIKAGSLDLRDTIEESVQKELSDRDHDVTVSTWPMATPVILYIDPASGTFYGAGDPETGRHAAGLKE
ncbi:MAG: gamma-glutamyltransferase [Lentisphaeria bacterium]|nr:gamma-glutamyltransferase [Lentisphaeria bacterium]NQZ70578.1 gamma-glutamyltransferase [Lentisphaeria bacterium]